MATNPILGRDVYIALAAVGWADGQLTKAAADAIVRTAREEGLPEEEVQAIESATRSKVEIGEIDRMNMSKADRLYVYAIASWIAALDGHASDSQKEALEQLGEALQIPETPRHRVDEIVRAMASEADKPERFDLRALRATLDERHEAARQARIARSMEEAAAAGEATAAAEASDPEGA